MRAWVNRFEQNLRIPGPTSLPPSVREAGARQMINHRGPDFTVMFTRILERLRPWFGTNGEIAILSCVGSGGLEAAVVNTVSPGDRVLAATMGLFGERIALMAEEFGADVTRLAVDWGQAIDPDALRELLAEGPGYRSVFLTHNETSTGVINPIEELVAVVHEVQPEALVIV